MKKLFLLMLAMVAMVNTVSAQEVERDYQLYPYAFGSLQGGVLKTYTAPGIDRDFKPMGAVSLGYFFTQVFGTRLQFGASQWKTNIAALNGDYKNKYYDIGLDLMFNFSNLFFPNRNNLINVIGIAGVPFELAVPHTYVDNYKGSVTEGNKKWKKGWKGGGMIDINIAKHFSINLEGGTNYIMKRSDDDFDKGKWWPYALAGITYKFGHKKVKVAEPEPYVPVPQYVEEASKPVVKEQPKPEPKPVPKPEPKKVPAKTTSNIFFPINNSVIQADQLSKIDEIANWAKSHPEASIELTGYADRETGNEKINQSLSEKRAAAVKAALVGKGVAASRIKTDAKGDKVQPFSVNDQNRAVIVLGEEK
ncbi:MAG: OmpA family protein [Prevotella sp.]|nr:OmpA family protein [Prevotella sp.]